MAINEYMWDSIIEADRRYNTGSARACAEFAHAQLYDLESCEEYRGASKRYHQLDLLHIDYSIAEKYRGLAGSLKSRNAAMITHYRAVLYWLQARRRMIVYLRDQLGFTD